MAQNDEASQTANKGEYDNDLSAEFGIVVNGQSLVHCLHASLEKLFLDVSSQCRSVICCRVTPLQKALVVELIRHHKQAVTLAIGDGANDVSMIKGKYLILGVIIIANIYLQCLKPACIPGVCKKDILCKNIAQLEAP